MNTYTNYTNLRTSLRAGFSPESWCAMMLCAILLFSGNALAQNTHVQNVYMSPDLPSKFNFGKAHKSVASLKLCGDQKVKYSIAKSWHVKFPNADQYNSWHPQAEMSCGENFSVGVYENSYRDASFYIKGIARLGSFSVGPMFATYSGRVRPVLVTEYEMTKSWSAIALTDSRFREGLGQAKYVAAFKFTF